jgi:outer membrane biosynthesis protein TonB
VAVTALRVEPVRVVRSIGLLNNAAIEAVKQWRYSPLVLNGTLTPFVLTVTLSFSLQEKVGGPASRHRSSWCR